jgi:Leucine-rich repeat (LRR) protein
LNLSKLKSLRELKLNGNYIKETPPSLEEFTNSLTKFKL